MSDWRFWGLLIAILAILVPAYLTVAQGRGWLPFPDKQSGKIVNTELIYNGATKQVTDGLLVVSKTLKGGDIPGAEIVLQGIPKSNLTPTDLTNIQSTTAGIALAKGEHVAAETIYSAIIATGTSSNAVFSGMAVIEAFKAFTLQKSDPQKAIAHLNESNIWYLKALAGDKRPQATVTIYNGLYENYRILTQVFKQNEQQNFENYRDLFLEANKKAGHPYMMQQSDN